MSARVERWTRTKGSNVLLESEPQPKWTDI